MIKLTRLNQQIVAINPENILWADASPDTTLCMTGGEKVLVRESLDELLDRVIAYQRLIRRDPDAPRAGCEAASDSPPKHKPFSDRPDEP
ncbi:MAG: flagellar FlbD family protein [Myxococcales bacterium]|nr:flagellar FlbD family protein [Myxococcales bacterium]